MSSVFELLIILVLIVLNGVFAMSEAALISTRRARLEQRKNEGEKRADSALRFLDNPNAFLATSQIAISLIGILSGAFGGATLAAALVPAISQVEVLRPYANALALALTVLFITFLSLVIGELVPKQLALNDPEKTILRVAGPMRVLSRLATPLVRLLDVSTRFVLRLIGVRPSDDPIVTEEEIKVMIDQGTRAGEFEETEQFLVRRVFRLADVNLEAVMTPRRDVVWLDADDPPEEVRRKVNASGRSRFPLAHGNLENVLGVVHAKDLLARSLAGEPFNLRQAMQPAMFVPSSLSALDMLQRFKTMGVRLALVIDEFGGLQGIVTMSDIMDEIIGGEFLTSETPEPHAVQREDGSWLLDGLMSIDEVKDVLNLRELPGEEDGDFTTLGGFMMHQFGRIPSASDQVNVGSLCFEVVDMDGHRVDKVLVRLVTPQPGENPEIDG